MLKDALTDWHSPLWWNVCWFLANAALIGRRGYIFYKEEGLSASKQFALRAESLLYVAIWGVFAIATIVFGILAGDEGDFVNAVGVLAAEYIGVCLWAHYYGNGDLVCRVVKEARERLSFLLIQGLGMNATEREQFYTALENAIVELWKKKLKEKKWSSSSIEEKNDLIFDTGVECGKVLEDQWEGILYDVAAFFHEWVRGVQDERRVRVPAKIVQSMKSGNDAGSQSLLSVAVLVANEDESLRKKREDSQQALAERQFCGARIARRKTAAEGILRWPDSVAGTTRVDLDMVQLNTDELFIVNGPSEYQCEQTLLPHSVLYTLFEIVRAGYVKRQPNGMIEATVTFKYGNMVFNKDQWNQLRTIERKPFRFITSATWMSGEPAFVVEQREITGSAKNLDGSGFLKGTLKFAASGRIRESNSWVEQSTSEIEENETVWGKLEGIGKAEPLPILLRPMMWMILAPWWLYACYMHLSHLFKNPTQPSRSLPLFQRPTHAPTGETPTAVDLLVLTPSGKEREENLIKAESMYLWDCVSKKASSSSKTASTSSSFEK